MSELSQSKKRKKKRKIDCGLLHFCEARHPLFTVMTPGFLIQECRDHPLEFRLA